MTLSRRGGRTSLESEAEELLREIAHDSVDAARSGYRIARRAGRMGLRWLDEASDRALRELDKRRPR
jgi:hypothetical protein